MSDISETPDLEAQIVALIRLASERLQLQLEEVGRNAGSTHNRSQESVTES